MSFAIRAKAWRAIGTAILLGGLWFSLPAPAEAVQTVTLGWSPSTDPTVIGYRLYYGVTSRMYTNNVNAGNKTVATISGLVEGKVYYFVVTAYTTLGVESLPSNEVAYVVPGNPSPSIPRVPGCTLAVRQTPTSAGAILSITSIASSNTPSSWELEASTDLKSWKTITLGSNSLVNAFVVPSATSKRFFRLKSNPPVSLAMRKPQSNELPGSFYLTTVSPAPRKWRVETSLDLKKWSTLASGTNIPVNVAVLPAPPPAMFFRLKGK